MNLLKFFRSRKFLTVLCFFLATAICFVVAPSISKTATKQTQIIRVTQTIPEGTAITSAMITTAKVGGYNLPTNILKKPQDVIGKYTTAELQPGDYILSSKVSVQSGSPYLANLDGKEQAISIPIKSFAAGLSGKLQSGDIVSLIVSNYGTAKQTVAPPELKYVSLLAATNAQGEDTDQVEKAQKGDDSTSDQDKNIPATLTLLVNSDQATKLVDYASNGSLYAALVYRGVETQARKYLEIQNEYFQKQTGSVPVPASDQDNSTAEVGGAADNGK